MAIISQVQLTIETVSNTSDMLHAQVSYQLNFSKCEALGEFIFLEQVALCCTDPTDDLHLSTLYKSCVKAQSERVNRTLQTEVELASLRAQHQSLNLTDNEALYVRVTLVPYTPQATENMSNPVYL